MYIIDTDVLVSELLNKYKKDEQTKKVLAFYRKIPLMKRVIPDFIISEFELFMTNVIPVRFSLPASEKNQLTDTIKVYMRQISSHCTLMSPNQQIMKNAFSLYQQPKTDTISNNISFTDSLLLSTAIQLQYTIISMDVNLNEYAAELHIPYYEIKN